MYFIVLQCIVLDLVIHDLCVKIASVMLLVKLRDYTSFPCNVFAFCNCRKNDFSVKYKSTISTIVAIFLDKYEP